MIRRSGDQTGALLPIPAWRRSSWNLPLLGASLVVLVVALLGGPIRTRVRHRYGLPPVAREAAVVPPAVSIVVGLDLVFAAGWIVILVALAMGQVQWFGRRLDPWIRLLQLVGLAGAIGSVVAVRSALGPTVAGWTVRVGRLVVAAATLAIVWLAFAFHLLSSRLRY